MTKTATPKYPTKKCVPWLSWDEWRATMDLLFSPQCADRKEGIRRVNLWSCRSIVGSLTVATSQLINLLSIENGPTSYRTTNEVRCLFSSIITRTYDGIKRASDKNLIKTTDRQMIPPWSRQIRNLAVHGELPSLENLRASGIFLLDLIKNLFWWPQLRIINHVESSFSGCKRKLKSHIEENDFPLLSSFQSVELFFSLISNIPDFEEWTTNLNRSFPYLIEETGDTIIKLKKTWPWIFDRMIEQFTNNLVLLSSEGSKYDQHGAVRIRYISRWIDHILGRKYELERSEQILTFPNKNSLEPLINCCHSMKEFYIVVVILSLFSKHSAINGFTLFDNNDRSPENLNCIYYLTDFENMLQNDDFYHATLKKSRKNNAEACNNNMWEECTIWKPSPIGLVIDEINFKT